MLVDVSHWPVLPFCMGQSPSTQQPETQRELHFLRPPQSKLHWVPSHEGVPPSGAWHLSQDWPQWSTELLSTHVPEQRCMVALHAGGPSGATSPRTSPPASVASPVAASRASWPSCAPPRVARGWCRPAPRRGGAAQCSPSGQALAGDGGRAGASSFGWFLYSHPEPPAASSPSATTT